MNEDMALQQAESTEIVVFDYNQVGEETAGFLKERARKIIDIRMKSVLSIGKELRSAQDKLSSHDKTHGTFVKWCESLGIKKSTAFNYINAHNYVVQNLDNISDPEKIQTSLLFAISKPSAPPDLQQAVIDGDITTHKDYLAALDAKKRAEAAAEKAKKEAESRSAEIEKLTAEKNVLESDVKLRDTMLKSTQGDVKRLEAELKKKRDGKDTVRVSELENELEKVKKKLQEEQEYIKEVDEIVAEKEKIIKELRSKPIDVTATTEVPPADYEKNKRENEYLRKENEALRSSDAVEVNQAISAVLALVPRQIEAWAKVSDPEIQGNMVDFALNKLKLAKEALQPDFDDLAGGGITTSNGKDMCCTCKNYDTDNVSEEQLEDNKGYCKEQENVVSCDDFCSNYIDVLSK